MNLLELVNRRTPPGPWAEGDNIPWNEPGFSTRMLREHLSQEHDAASRRFATIDSHVAWIHDQVLDGQAARVLDLGCGPGLYSSRLARLGHQCVGIDWGPASIRFARDTAEAEGLDCRYLLEDIRQADLGANFDLVMLLYGEFNVFRPTDARLLLARMAKALAPGGRLLIEYQTAESVRRLAQCGASWYSAVEGLFADVPHVCLEERFWDEKAGTCTTRFFIVDARTASVTAHALTTQAYSQEALYAALAEAGLTCVHLVPSLAGEGPADPDFRIVLARRP